MCTAEVMVAINKLVTFHRYLDVVLLRRLTKSVRRSSIVPFPSYGHRSESFYLSSYLQLLLFESFPLFLHHLLRSFKSRSSCANARLSWRSVTRHCAAPEALTSRVIVAGYWTRKRCADGWAHFALIVQSIKTKCKKAIFSSFNTCTWQKMESAVDPCMYIIHVRKHFFPYW